MSDRTSPIFSNVALTFVVLVTLAFAALAPKAEAQPAGRTCSAAYRTGNGAQIIACANNYDFGLWLYNDTERTITLDVDECRFSWKNGWTHNQTAGSFTMRPGSRAYQTLFVDDGLFAPGNAPTWRCNIEEQVR